MGIVRQLDHLAVTVTDLQRSVPFYVQILGLEEVERHHLEGENISKMVGKPGVIMEVVRLRSPNTPEILIDLQQYVIPQVPSSNAALGMANHGHFCFIIDDMDAAYKLLSSQGVEFVSDPVRFDISGQIMKVVFFKDPDGLILELMESSGIPSYA